MFESHPCISSLVRDPVTAAWWVRIVANDVSPTKPNEAIRRFTWLFSLKLNFSVE